MSQVGRISGPLLFANLERNGIDLKISNTTGSSPILKFDVTNNRIGIGTETPISDLQVPTSFNTTNLIVTNTVNVADFTLENNQINVNSGDIEIDSGSIIEASAIATEEIKIEENNIYTTVSNANIELIPSASKPRGIDPDTEIVSGTLNRSTDNASNTIDFAYFGIGGTFYETAFRADEVLGVRIGNNIDQSSVSNGDFIHIVFEDGTDAFLEIDSSGTHQSNRKVYIINNPISDYTTDGDPSPVGAVSVTFGSSIVSSQIDYKTDIQSDLDVDENLHATGNITFGGSITLGSDADDDITFAADVKSDIIPDVGSTYNFGLSNDGDSTYQRYSELQSVNIDTTRARANSITINGNDYGLPTGNSFYVDPNGDDANRGDHPQAPFRTIKRALDAADSSPQGMTTVLIQAGEYIEEFPLTVPADTNVMGSGFREVEVKPTQGTNTEDAFLLTGETTVQNLTVMDFFYDSGNDKGYAFRFANNAITSRRSPYVQNVSVITKGSVTSASDPRGFDEGDAGRGALVDGSALDSNSVQASMLFHSVTFLTAGAIGLRMKDGVRVEWLNSFTYFADIGLKAENGTTGFVSPHDGSTRNFGAELRSIGSANVYGNKGAVADGDDCLMYLIQHNMAYIGTGKSKENDKTLVNHDNEIEKLNSGRIFFQTTDARGRFQVGDSFFADFDTGTTSIDADNVAFDTLSQITVTSGQDETFIDGTRIDTGNIVLSGNKISSSDGNLTLDAVGNHDIRSNVTMKGKLDVSGDISIGQTLTTIGDADTDTVEFNVDLDQDLKPGDGGIRSLGSSSKRWQNVYVSEANIDDIRIFDNVITTTASNADLDLRANGTGRVLLDSNDMQVTQNLTVNGVTTIPGLDVTGTLNYTGDVSYPNGYDVVGDLNIRNLTVTRDVHLKEFEIRGNRIDGIVTNQDVELRAAGTGRVLIDLNDAFVDGNVSVRTYDVIGNVTYTGEQTSPSYATNNINIETNFIETTQSNSDLEFRASGTGRVLVENLFFRDRTITSGPPGIANGRINLTPADNLNITGTGSLKLPNGAVSQRRNELGDLRFNTERNLFEGYGASVVTLGGLYSDDQQTFVRAHPVNNHLDFNVAGSQVGTINYAQVEMSGLQTDDILVDGAKITTNVSNSDLELTPNGTGEVKILTSTINIDNLSSGIIENDQAGALTISATGDGYHKMAGTFGVAIPHGTNAQRGSGNQVGDTRYNTEEAYMETWDGNVWQVSAGGGGATVSQEEMEQLILEYSLALG